ncbi:uncharacterized protein LOC113326469 [Papaver somniferum]|uniref:uncharacterized protein LOC113326469 n=1 Tax=Papaver somniferum TaxID=3469 RepID=UPI000E6FA0D9|nr:uncharacterized protein LOC113326469 [Papaver somniferum]
MITRGKDGIFKPKSLLSSKYTTITDAFFEPCYSQEKKDPKWRKSMDDQYNYLLQNGTWSYVKRTPDMNVVGCKWVFRVKRLADGTIERRKSRLVAQGFHQREGKEYGETFSPVIKPCTIRVILTLALISA